MKFIRFALVLCLLPALPALAFELVRSSLDGGGGRSQGGDFSLRGSLGQWDAGLAAADSFQLRGGFWQGGPAPTSVPETGSPVFSRLRAPVPNPFNPKTIIAFDLAEDGPASLRIYNVQGRLVRVLVDEPLPAGAHEAVWNGLNETGGEVASGVYLVQMRARGFAAVHKAVMVR